jgi:hypothetical protein
MMKNKTALALTLTAAFAGAAAVYGLQNAEFRAPLEFNDGKTKHGIMMCADQDNATVYTFDTRKTQAVWRPLGENSWEFTDIITQQKREILESKRANLNCMKVDQDALKVLKSTLGL